MEEGLSRTDEDLVDSYVAAINDRDFAEFNRLRCSSSQTDPRTADLFRDQIGRLLDHGALSVSRITVPSEHPSYDRIEELGEDAVVAEVWFAFDGVEAEPLYNFIGTENGERRLCGWADPKAAQRLDSVKELVVDLGPTTASVDQLLAVTPPTGYNAVAGDSIPGADDPDPPGLTQHGATHLSNGDYGGITIAVAKFDTAAHAHERAEVRATEAIASSASLEPLDEPLGTYAVFIAPYSWSYVQPSSIGPYLEQTILVYGDTVIYVSQTEIEPADGDAEWRALVQEIDLIARQG